MKRIVLALSVIALTACGGGGGGSTLDAEEQAVNNPPVATNCAPDCFLAASDVDQIIAQAVAEATARSELATIAVVDRVGNVLGVYQMTGAEPFVTITSTHDSGQPVSGGLENLNFIPATLAAVSKAMTGA